MNELTEKMFRCACHTHVLVVDAADWDCEGDADNKWATLDLTMWEQVPQRHKTPWYRDLFYLPRYTWKLRELWRTWKGQRYAEWVVLDYDKTVELRDYLTQLLDKKKEGVSK